MTNNNTNIFSLEKRLNQKNSSQFKPQSQSNSLIIQTNALTDAIFDINASFYGDQLNSKVIYSFALESYFQLLSKNVFSVLNSQMEIEPHLIQMFSKPEPNYQTRDFELSNGDLDNILGIECQFDSIVQDEHYSKAYKITKVPSHQQLFDNACNNYTNCLFKHLIGQGSEIKFPSLKDFKENPNLDYQAKLMLNNLDKLIIKPSTYNSQTGEIHTEPDLDITQKEYETQLKDFL